MSTSQLQAGYPPCQDSTGSAEDDLCSKALKDQFHILQLELANMQSERQAQHEAMLKLMKSQAGGADLSALVQTEVEKAIAVLNINMKLEMTVVVEKALRDQGCFEMQGELCNLGTRLIAAERETSETSTFVANAISSQSWSCVSEMKEALDAQGEALQFQQSGLDATRHRVGVSERRHEVFVERVLTGFEDVLFTLSDIREPGSHKQSSSAVTAAESAALGQFVDGPLLVPTPPEGSLESIAQSLLLTNRPAESSLRAGLRKLFQSLKEDLEPSTSGSVYRAAAAVSTELPTPSGVGSFLPSPNVSVLIHTPSAGSLQAAPGSLKVHPAQPQRQTSPIGSPQLLPRRMLSQKRLPSASEASHATMAGVATPQTQMPAAKSGRQLPRQALGQAAVEVQQAPRQAPAVSLIVHNRRGTSPVRLGPTLLASQPVAQKLSTPGSMNLPGPSTSVVVRCASPATPVQGGSISAAPAFGGQQNIVRSRSASTAGRRTLSPLRTTIQLGSRPGGETSV